MNKIIICCFAVVLAVTGCSWAGGSPPGDSPDFRTVVYVSEKGDTLTATFDIKSDTVIVKLPGKNPLKLSRAVSASGARYSNDRTVFWEHHGEGTFWVGDMMIFRGRVKEP